MIKSEYKFLYVYDSSFLVDLSYSYAIFSIKSRPLNINIQRKFFLKNRMSNVTPSSKGLHLFSRLRYSTFVKIENLRGQFFARHPVHDIYTVYTLRTMVLVL